MVADLMEQTAVDGLAESIAARDYAAIAARFDADVRFRALTPNTTYGLFGPRCVAETFKLWFGASPEVELLTSEIDRLGDRIHVSYRVRAQEDGVSCIVEQHAYCRLRDGLIADMSLICSGYLPIEPAG
jgi:hypothetical protein